MWSMLYFLQMSSVGILIQRNNTFWILHLLFIHRRPEKSNIRWNTWGYYWGWWKTGKWRLPWRRRRLMSQFSETWAVCTVSNLTEGPSSGSYQHQWTWWLYQTSFFRWVQWSWRYHWQPHRIILDYNNKARYPLQRIESTSRMLDVS